MYVTQRREIKREKKGSRLSRGTPSTLRVTEVRESSIYLWVEVFVDDFLTARLPLLVRGHLVLRLRGNTTTPHEWEEPQVAVTQGTQMWRPPPVHVVSTYNDDSVVQDRL